MVALRGGMRTNLLLVAALVAAGCVHEDEATGSVAAALTAVDGDGATYRLPSGTALQLYNTTYYDEVSLDGDAAVVTIDLPVGDYGAALYHPYVSGNLWPLERTAPDGTVRIVDGYLVTPMPQSVSIFEGTTTSLALVFEVPEFGEITFAEGALDVSLEVEETTAGGVDLAAGGYYTITSVWTSPTAPDGLADRLPHEADIVEVGVNATVTGPFAKSSSIAACAPAQLTAIGSGNPAMIDLLIEANDQQRICVFATEPPRLMIQGVRAGAALTPTFADLFSGSWFFVGGVMVDLPAPVFDGHTLDLDPIAGTNTGPGTASYRVGGTVDGVPADWYLMEGQTNVTVTVSLTPG